MDQQGVLREAIPDDIPVLVRHRWQMAEDIASERGQTVNPVHWPGFEQAYAQYAGAHLRAGTLRAWVIELEGEIIASGCVSVYLWPPGQRPEGVAVGFVHSLFTEPRHRRRGMARRIIEAARVFCRAEKLAWLFLTYSESGKALYESEGFTPWNAMVLYP